MTRVQMKWTAFLCVMALVILQLSPVTSLAYTLSATGSALDSERTSISTGSALDSEITSIATGSALDSEITSIATGSALESIISFLATGGALDIEVEVIEENELPQIKNVVLPTIASDTYDFTIDIDGLLSEMYSNYEDGHSVYFSTVHSEAELKVSSKQKDATYTLSVYSKTSDGGKERLELNLLGKTMEELSVVFSSYYIWQPDVFSTTGDGKWTQLTVDNYSDIMELEWSEDGYITKVTYREIPCAITVDTIWDGNIYTITYTDISGMDAAAQFYDMEQASELVSYTNATLYVKEVDSSGLIFYHPATLEQNEPGSVYYRHATYTHADTSAPATITNKSTFDICVTAEVQVHNSEGLVFCSSPEFYNKSSDTANIYMGLTADHHCVPIMNNVAAASYILKGSGENSIRYLIANGLIEDTLIGTLNHYLSPVDSYASVDFQIEAAIDTRNSANSAWKSYVKALSDGTYARPVIDVVYTMEEVTRDIENSSYYVSEHGNTYVIADSTYGKEDFWISAMIPSSEVNVLLPEQLVYVIPHKMSNKKKEI